jgi:tetratricopeptide (TPR) repeat protein
MLRRVLAVMLVLGCAGLVAGYQVSRPDKAPADPRVFVPSPEFFLDFSPSFRTSIADAYYLYMIQYYGEHVMGDGRLDSLPAMTRMVTSLSPHFMRPYLFGAYAWREAGKGDDAYRLLERGFAKNPEAWRLATNAGILMYSYGPKDVKREIAARWFEKAAAIPDSPDYASRIAARLLGEGGEYEKSVALYAELYATGDKYSREKALSGLFHILPEDPGKRLRILEEARDLMASDTYEELVRKLGSAK